MGSSRAFLWGVLHNVMGVQRLYVSQLNTAHAALPQLPYPGKPKATPLLLVGCAAQRDQSAVPLLDGGSGFGKARLFGERCSLVGLKSCGWESGSPCSVLSQLVLPWERCSRTLRFRDLNLRKDEQDTYFTGHLQSPVPPPPPCFPKLRHILDFLINHAVIFYIYECYYSILP